MGRITTSVTFYQNFYRITSYNVCYTKLLRVLIMAATILCVLIGVPLGILAAHKRWLYAVLRPILDLMQTIPTFVYLIPAIIFFGIGVVPGLIATVIFVVAAPVRLTHLSEGDVLFVDEIHRLPRAVEEFLSYNFV